MPRSVYALFFPAAFILGSVLIFILIHNSKLVDFYEKNYVRLEEARQGLKVYDLSYPQMKLLDIGFWQIGFEEDADKGLQVLH